MYGSMLARIIECQQQKIITDEKTSWKKNLKNNLLYVIIILFTPR